MKINKCYSIATVMIAVCLASAGVQAAPRSTPVTVVNDAATPVPVDVISAVDNRYVYVGESNDIAPANAGSVGMNQKCALTYPESRMCATSELILTGGIFPQSTANQWIRPSFTSAVIDMSIVDYSGVVLQPRSMTCQTTNHGPWRSISATDTGLVYVPNSGRITYQTCDTAETKVACCAPR